MKTNTQTWKRNLNLEREPDSNLLELLETLKDRDSLVTRSVIEGIAFVSGEQTNARVTRIKNFTEILEESLTEMLAVERAEMQPTRRTVIA